MIIFAPLGPLLIGSMEMYLCYMYIALYLKKVKKITKLPSFFQNEGIFVELDELDELDKITHA